MYELHVFTIIYSVNLIRKMQIQFQDFYPKNSFYFMVWLLLERRRVTFIFGNYQLVGNFKLFIYNEDFYF